MSKTQEKARAMLAAATPGPWASGHDDQCAWVDCGDARKAAWLGGQSPGARNEENAELMAAAPGLIAALCDENDAMEHERGLAVGQRQSALANLAERDAQLSRQNAGLVQMARDRDAAIAERDALRGEVKRLNDSVAVQASELRDVWRMVSRVEIPDDYTPMVIAAVRMMKERHDSFKASTERLSDETVELRAEVDATRVERDVADRECDRLRAQVDADRQELTRMAEKVERMRALEVADLQRRAILDAMNGGEP